MMDVSIMVAVVLGLTEAAKRSGLPSKWAPLVSVALGVAYSVAFGTDDRATRVVGGIIIGLSASGLWSGTKAVVGK